jgi:DivIVA domain-containing protein
VALDRQSIEKKDFPVGRRGYDPDAVDTHLSSLADEVSELKRTARRRTDTLASSASQQVRAIVEAAESSATEIQRDAESDAREIRDEANSEAEATREQAAEQAREYVGKVSESTSTMMERLDSMESELSGLIESLRSGANRIAADLQLLEGSLTDASAVIAPRPTFELEGEPELAVGGEDDIEAVEIVEIETDSEGPDAAAADGTEPVIADGDGATSPDDVDDAEGARLIALNMALNGTPREETARYLSENFQLSDADGLLDEVYASVEG